MYNKCGLCCYCPQVSMQGGFYIASISFFYRFLSLTCLRLTFYVGNYLCRHYRLCIDKKRRTRPASTYFGLYNVLRRRRHYRRTSVGCLFLRLELLRSTPAANSLCLARRYGYSGGHCFRHTGRHSLYQNTSHRYLAVCRFISTGHHPRPIGRAYGQCNERRCFRSSDGRKFRDPIPRHHVSLCDLRQSTALAGRNLGRAN